MTDEPLLEVRDLEVSYPGVSGRVTALSGVSVSLAQGRSLGIVGESGSGKSTLALAILGLLPDGAQVGGTVKVAGVDIYRSPGRAVGKLRGRTMALVYQDALASLNPVRTIGSQITEVLRRHFPELSRAEVRQRAVEVLRHVGIAGPERRMKQYSHEFSGGMRQRVAIAMAVAARPRLLIADEPTTALDVTVRTQTLALLESMRQELGMAVVHVSHDLEVIRDVGDDVAVMYHGRIVEFGPTEEVLEKPRHPYTAALVESVPTVDTPNIAFIPGSPPRASDILPGCSFEPRCRVGHGNAQCVDVRPVLRDAPGSVRHDVSCHFPVGVGGVS